MFISGIPVVLPFHTCEIAHPQDRVYLRIPHIQSYHHYPFGLPLWTVRDFAQTCNRRELMVLAHLVSSALEGDAPSLIAQVAEEIGKLAGSTTVSAEEISNHIQEVRTSDAAARGLSHPVKTIRKQDAFVDRSQESFRRIANIVREIGVSLDRMKESIEHTSGARNEVLSVMDSNSRPSEVFVSTIEEVQASEQEQHRTASSIQDSMRALNELLQELTDVVKSFQV